jgi:hypothetical protein
MKIPRVTLELVRQGPPHNQLLSPLTPYFAICGNHEPEIVHVPFEHATLLRKLRNLRYQGPLGGGAPSEITADAEDVRRALVDMLCSIRGLHRELSARARGGTRLVALELVVSAAELALLPFELVFRPGMPARELTSADVVILRRTRRVPATSMRWPVRPRVLFAHASPRGDVPFRRHALALRECLAPWLVHAHHLDAIGGADEVRKYVTVIEQASLPAIREACERMAARDQEITHVHILSHGGQVDGKFGLLLHHPADPLAADFVTGERLAGALNATAPDGSRRLPACVTLAACDAGNTGDVVYAGASVAHELHEGGVPLVVASQLPLSFRGSVAMVRELYDHLLSVEDPQVALAKTRDAVRGWSVAGAGQMDWASVVAYGALPKQLGPQVSRGRLEQAKRAVESALGLVDPWISATGEPAHAEDDIRVSMEDVLLARRSMDVALCRLDDEGTPLDRASYLGAIYKRWAETLAAVPSAERKAPPGGDAHELDPAAAYRTAIDHYMDAHTESGAPYPLVQAFACRCFLAFQDLGSGTVAGKVGEVVLSDEWHAAVQLVALRARRPASPERRFEDQRALLELWLMVPLVFVEGERARPDARVCEALGGDPVRLLVEKIAGNAPDSFELYSMRRQVVRFRAIARSLAAARGEEGLARAAREQFAARVSALLGGLDSVGARKVWTAVMDYRREGGASRPTVSTQPEP